MALIDEIRALPPEILATKSTQQIADALPPREVLVKTATGKGTIIEAIGLDAANSFLDYIDNTPDFRHMKHLLVKDQGGLDMSVASVRTTLDILGASGLIELFGPAQAEALKALAVQLVPVTEFELRKICWSDEAVWLI